MNLKFIKTDSCPICGDKTVITEQIETSVDGKVLCHVNGGLWEKRKFSCGQMIQYIPNFKTTEISKIQFCKNNDEYRNKIVKREKAKKSVEKFINELEDLDEEYKDLLLRQYKYI